MLKLHIFHGYLRCLYTNFAICNIQGKIKRLTFKEQENTLLFLLQIRSLTTPMTYNAFDNKIIIH